MNQQYEELLSRAGTLNSMFRGNDFQRIKGSGTDRKNLGGVLKVNSIEPNMQGRISVKMSDGSIIDSEQLTSQWAMISEDTPAMSMDEVLSINYIPSLADDSTADVGSLKAMKAVNAPTVLQEVQFTGTVSATSNAAAVSSNTLIQLANKKQDPAELFGMFASSEVDLKLTVKVVMPSFSLLQVMYAQSVNKDEFAMKLASYIQSNITIDAIKSSVLNKLDKRKTNVIDLD